MSLFKKVLITGVLLYVVLFWFFPKVALALALLELCFICANVEKFRQLFKRTG
jgi:hypothetical protein